LIIPVWKRAEKGYSKKSGLPITKRSGAGTKKGDCADHITKVEVKSSTRKDSNGYYIIIQADWFRKIKRQAHAEGTNPRIDLALGFPLEDFEFIYDPFDHSEGTIIQKTMKVYLNDLRKMKVIIIDEEVWKKDD